MNHSLAEPLPRKFIYQNKKYKLRLTVGRVLTCYEILQNECFNDLWKINLCLDILLPMNWLKLRRLPDIDKSQLLEYIFSNFVNEKTKKSTNNIKTFDFLQDSKYIYAAFLQSYRIDLIDEKDKLHWWKFISLFSSLPSDTRMAQIMDIRSRPIPKATKYNNEERAHLLRLKSEFRLELSEAERQANLQEGLAKIAVTLEGMIKRKA